MTNMTTDGSRWKPTARDSAEPEDHSKLSDDVSVRVWFGPSEVAHYRADRDLAERYVADVGRHFHGLRFTISPLPDQAQPTRPLPAERLWMFTP